MIVSNIFNLREKDATQVMEPLKNIRMISMASTVSDMRKIIKETSQWFFPLFDRVATNIVGIAMPRDLLRLSDTDLVNEKARAPWFITQKTKVFDILRQFRTNTQSVAIVLDEKGKAVGVITLDDLMEEIFGKFTFHAHVGGVRAAHHNFPLVERTFPGEKRVAEFNEQFHAHLPTGEGGRATFAELLEERLGHHPGVGESVYISPYEIIVKEASLLEIRSVVVKTRV